jgi:hypothetical protein
MKKTWVVLPVAAVMAVGMVACSESPAGLAPDAPRFELADTAKRVLANNVNAHVYGSFSISFDGGGSLGHLAGGHQANFPGNPKNAGHCGNAGYATDWENDPDAGVWFNPRGHRTTGSKTKPHPHCVDVGSGGGTVVVVLEPISVENKRIGETNEMLEFARQDADGKVHRIAGGTTTGGTQGQGVIQAYAIDHATLGSSNVRVGILTIALTEYGDNSVNYFHTGCDMGVPDTGALPCLNKVIKADYMPLAGPDGVGSSITQADWDEAVDGPYPLTGYLYWYRLTGADQKPFNYTDMPD